MELNVESYVDLALVQNEPSARMEPHNNIYASTN